MKCRFVLDVGVDVSVLSEADRNLLRWREVRSRGKPKLEPYFPAGTEYETPAAAYFVDRGMALPADLECENACAPLSPEQRSRLTMAYQADEAGVVDRNDRELFFAGVIAGYEVVNGQTAYRPGPNYASWKAAQDKVKKSTVKKAPEVPI